MEIRDKVFWYTQKIPQIKPLSENLECDTVIVGGGMAGLSAAQTLQEHGQKVILLEQDFCGGGASGKSSGFITPDSELELSNLIETYGKEKAKKLWDFVVSGVEKIRQNIEQHNISCDYEVQDSLFVANASGKTKRIKKEHDARTSLGYESRLYHENEISQVIGSNEYYGAVRYPDTFGINAYLYCQGLKEILETKGVQIYEQSRVTEILKDGVKLASYKVTAKNILVCADRFSPALGVMKPQVYQAQTFLAISKPLPEAATTKMFPDAKTMVWDTDLIYQYYRVVAENRLLIGAASMFYTYVPFEIKHSAAIMRKMKGYLSQKFPWFEVELEYFWPGMIGVSKDLVPLAAQDPEQKNLYYMAAPTGLPWAAAIGSYIADKSMTGRSDFDEEFKFQRKYPIGKTLQALIRKPITFALSHGIVKYFN
jgi:gamma-glutamylputrescine oxidase